MINAATATPSSFSASSSGTGALTQIREFLAFKIANEEYGVDILRVQEIRSYEKPTTIANAAEHLKGVVNLRGVIVPIIDLRIKLGVGEVILVEAGDVIPTDGEIIEGMASVNEAALARARARRSGGTPG